MFIKFCFEIGLYWSRLPWFPSILKIQLRISIIKYLLCGWVHFFGVRSQLSLSQLFFFHIISCLFFLSAWVLPTWKGILKNSISKCIFWFYSLGFCKCWVCWVVWLVEEGYFLLFLFGIIKIWPQKIPFPGKLTILTSSGIWRCGSG
jgi:hypothetical protein